RSRGFAVVSPGLGVLPMRSLKWKWYVLGFAALSVSQLVLAGEENASSVLEDEKIVAAIRYNTIQPSVRSCNRSETVVTDIRVYASGLIKRRETVNYRLCSSHGDPIPVTSMKREKRTQIQATEIPPLIQQLGRLEIGMRPGAYGALDAEQPALSISLSQMA